ncbi:unnamed protein product [Brassica oleracea var. botrytis]
MFWNTMWVSNVLLVVLYEQDDKEFLDTCFVSNQYVHRPCSADSSCGNCCNFVEFPRKLLTGRFPFLQPPISCLFPRSAPYSTFRSCRNLHSFDVDNIRFLGTYDKKINDLHKYSEAKSKLDFVEITLRWRHLAPTAPNTLNCYPFTDGDSFVIETCPHVINITTVW